VPAGRLTTALLVFLALLAPAAAFPDDDFAARRAALVGEVRAQGRIDTPGGFDEAVLQAMARVERHRFVPEGVRDDAYRNHPLPIGHGQTISQPYIVALMTHLLEAGADDTVLEIGTGSGYQAAVLAERVGQVYTIEIVEPLARQAETRLADLGYANVTTRLGDGYFGWPEQAPFDAIIVTAAAGHVPPPLIAQLAPGGRMVIPVGNPFLTQYLLLVEKDADGEVRSRQITAVRFVPLTGGH
jgi:protein-L-isoaspartate(D-aspartate) O-methyltransferase